jgi:serine-type D-Ala-D-Ala carboxypeptidase/endopeptidase (penicillin-binding protein 4)
MRFQIRTLAGIAVLCLVPFGDSAAAERRSFRPQNLPPAARLVPVEEDLVPAPGPDDPARDRILRLQEQLTGIVGGPVLSGVRVGMRVIDATSGRTFFRSGGTTMMDPASNQKVLATTAALMRLGAGFRFRTEVLGPAPDGTGVVRGDLFLRGNGDPSLRMADLEHLATGLAARGVLRVEGAVVADPRRIGSPESHPDERTPLRVHKTFIHIRVRPSLDGLPPLVTVKPEVEGLEVRNRAMTGGRGRSLRLSLSASADGITIDLAGRLSPDHPGVLMRRIAPDQRLFTAALLRQVMIDSGIEVRDRARLLDRPARAAGSNDSVLALHQSEPLSVLTRRINKESDNEWADRLLDVVGAELYGGPATVDKGLRALREAMDELGVPRESYLPTNGSGLGHGNRLTADALTELLHKIYLDPRWGPELLQSLSVGGVDGTTRNRFRGSPAAERVRTKTGTLMGKSCISGYVGDGHEVLAFSIFVDGIRNRRFTTGAVRAAQVSAVNAMMRYARGVEFPAGDEIQPGIDYEGGDELLNADVEEGAAAAAAVPQARPAPEPRPRPASARPLPVEPEVEIVPDFADSYAEPVPRPPSYSGNRRPGSGTQRSPARR